MLEPGVQGLGGQEVALQCGCCLHLPRAGLAALLVAVSLLPAQAGTASMWAPARTSLNSWMTGTALQSCSSATGMPTAPEDLLPLGVQGELSGSLPGTHPLPISLFLLDLPPSFPACQGGGPASGQLSGREELRRRFCEGWSLQRSLGMAPVALVQGVGRKTTRGSRLQ